MQLPASSPLIVMPPQIMSTHRRGQAARLVAKVPVEINVQGGQRLQVNEVAAVRTAAKAAVGGWGGMPQCARFGVRLQGAACVSQQAESHPDAQPTTVRQLRSCNPQAAAAVAQAAPWQDAHQTQRASRTGRRRRWGPSTRSVGAGEVRW